MIPNLYIEERTRIEPAVKHKYEIGSIKGKEIIVALVGWRVKANLYLKKQVN